MVKKAGDGEILRCSFCNKDQNDVRKLIAGPKSARPKTALRHLS